MSGLRIIGYAEPSPEQWDFTIRGMRNSWESWQKGDSEVQHDAELAIGFDFGPADTALALRLAQIGSDHGKYLRMLPVIVEIEAPGYWWKEFDTYRVGVEASDVTQNSTSMMHTLGREPFHSDMFCFEGIDPVAADYLVRSLNRLRDAWIATGKHKGPEAAAWRALQQAVPYGFLYHRTVSLNYQVLRSIYHARRNHRLAEWRTFCTWIEMLPNSALLTTTKEKS